ncbi:MAG: sigma-70 family RNA polymerase sigma factor [Crocinitomicaceae bacterium]|nr:sigma-70 family RNA polymerase sigma factor [Crocinitomicaceae bacterium]MCF8434642.1 sigma-70 family RNA polymerase sigma factor [Crocinitomicaceae bacterium]
MFKKRYHKLSDEELMVQVMDHHSHPAIVELHSRYSQKLLGYFMKMLNKDLDLSQDFVQEIFLKILEKKHLYDPSKKFYTWLFTIASNMCKTSYRRVPFNRISDDGYELNQSIHLNENLADKENFKQLLHESIETLEFGQKTVFVLRYMEQFSLNEIAEIMEISTGTVKSRLFYATQKIAKQLSIYDPQYESNLFKLS